MNTYAIYVKLETMEGIEEYHYDANTVEEALGKFFIDNSCLSYDDIVEHVEL